MNSATEIQEYIQRLAGTFGRDFVSITFAKVTSVDIPKRLCNCVAVGGDATTVIEDVELMAVSGDGMLLVPKLESFVLLANSTRNVFFIAMYSDLDKVFISAETSIQFNNGLDGGLVQVNALTLSLNQLVIELTAQLALIATGIAAGGGSYSPGTLSTFSKTDYENTTITHGS